MPKFHVRSQSRVDRRTGLAVAGVLLSLAVAISPRDSSAQACGGVGQPGCGIFKSDCAKNLALVNSRCAPCGRDGEVACPVTVRIPSCFDNLIENAGRCFQKGACGNDGQRACLLWERVPSCNDRNLAEQGSGQPGINVCRHPACGRQDERPCTVTERPALPTCDLGLSNVAGRCTRVTLDCGKMGQRACTVAERVAIGGRACEPGLDEAPGCQGECKGSSGMCFNRNVPMPEVATNVVRTLPATNALRGYADVHVHMFGHLALGGGVIAGAPYDPAGGAAKALGPDFGTDLDLILPTTGQNQRFGLCPPLVANCGKNVFHGDHIAVVDDFLGANGDSSKSYFGAPIFSGWPTWRAKTHQQVYYKWLERAWQGGMRAMVMLAVTNEFACTASKRLRGTVCTDAMTNVNQQLDAARAFEAWHAAQPGGGWFKIVTTPEEAERTIRDGKLAVVLGIEADVLFGCRKNSTSCTEAHVNSEVDKYFAKGVRYIFPIHDFDTAFGGPALFIDALGAANLTIAGAPFISAPCPGISDKGSLNCNTRGLTPIGDFLLNKLMDVGMMIDIDHMSVKMIDETFAVADKRGGYPFFVGHGLFNEVYASGARNRHERMRTAAQLARLKQYGGLVSVMTEDELGTTQTRCKNSSVSFAQNYDYAVSKMGIVALGSDFNGQAGHVGPRFGDDACGGEASQKSSQTQLLRYPFTIPGFAEFDRQVSGQRTFDFNFDGLAHVGLYPDLLADLALTRGAGYIEPVMQSANELVQAWYRGIAKSKTRLNVKRIPNLTGPPAGKLISPKFQPVPTVTPEAQPRFMPGKDLRKDRF